MDMKELKERIDVKTIMVFVIVILAIIFVIQNLQEVKFKILFIDIAMPGLILYTLLIAIGFLLGYQFARRKQDNKQ